jgi:hypothetical protein
LCSTLPVLIWGRAIRRRLRTAVFDRPLTAA